MATALAFPRVLVVIKPSLRIQVFIATIAEPVYVWKSTHDQFLFLYSV